MQQKMMSATWNQNFYKIVMKGKKAKRSRLQSTNTNISSFKLKG